MKDYYFLCICVFCIVNVRVLFLMDRCVIILYPLWKKKKVEEKKRRGKNDRKRREELQEKGKRKRKEIEKKRIL